MRPSIHFLVSLIIAIFIFPLYGWKALIVLLGGVFIDIDHYFLYYFWFKKTNPIKAYSYFAKGYHERIIGALFIFHSIEFLIVLGILSFFSEIIFLFTLGIAFHYLFDFVFELGLMKRLIKAWSFLLWLRRVKGSSK